jgi:hypothetical protein
LKFCTHIAECCVSPYQPTVILCSFSILQFINSTYTRVYHVAKKISLLHHTQVLRQSTLCKADHVYLAYHMLQRQFSNLKTVVILTTAKILRVILRPPVSRPVCLGIKPPSGAYDQIFITVRRLRVCWYGAPSLTRERVCLLQLLRFRQRSHSQVRVPRGSWPHFTVSVLRLPQPGEPGPCIYIPQEQGGPVIPPGTGFSYRLSLYRLRMDRIENTSSVLLLRRNVYRASSEQ